MTIIDDMSNIKDMVFLSGRGTDKEWWLIIDDMLNIKDTVFISGRHKPLRTIKDHMSTIKDHMSTIKDMAFSSGIETLEKRCS